MNITHLITLMIMTCSQETAGLFGVHLVLIKHAQKYVYCSSDGTNIWFDINSVLSMQDISPYFYLWLYCILLDLFQTDLEDFFFGYIIKWYDSVFSLVCQTFVYDNVWCMMHDVWCMMITLHYFLTCLYGWLSVYDLIKWHCMGCDNLKIQGMSKEDGVWTRIAAFHTLDIDIVHEVWGMRVVWWCYYDVMHVNVVCDEGLKMWVFICIDYIATSVGSDQQKQQQQLGCVVRVV